jgi:hypothetical protein
MAMPWNLLSAPPNKLMRYLLYGIIFFLSLSMLIFVAGFICYQLDLSLLTSLLYGLAERILLLAFLLLALSGLMALLSAVCVDLRGYFRQDARAVRQIFAVQTRKHNLARRLALEIRQIQYFSNLKRQRLLQADNRKHLQELYNAILLELESAKPQLPANRFAEMHKALRQYLKQADDQAMLTLRQQITNL